MKNFCLILCMAILLHVNEAYGAEAGMPQLNPEFWISQIFWLVLTFSVLYLVIWKVFIPKITYTVENRKSKIINDLHEAQKLRENAEKKLGEYNKIIENSKKEAKKIIEDGKKKLNLDLEIKRKKFNEEIEKEIVAVEKEIKELKDSSIININKIAIEISSEIVKQLIDAEVNKSNVSAIVNEIAKKKVGNQV